MTRQASGARFARRRSLVILAAGTIVAVAVYAATARDAQHSRAPIGRVSSARQGRLGDVPAVNANAVYAGTVSVRADIANDVNRVYVPSGVGDKVTVIDPTTKQIVSQFSTGRATTPQHVIPSFDLKTLWVLLNKSDHVIPIDARTGTVGAPIPANDPYNMYFTPDGSSAIVVAEQHSRLDFRDPHTMKLQQSVSVPACRGLNHADYSADTASLLLTCEFSGTVVKVDMKSRRVVGSMTLATPAGRTPVMTEMPDHSMASSMPQDIRLSPDGTRFYVADMLQGGVHVIDARRLHEASFIPTGEGAHSITPSHDGRWLYIANRGSNRTRAAPHGPGSVSVIDVATATVIAKWPVPDGGSPDMGNLTADGKELWLSGRFDAEVYAFDTTTGGLAARVHVPPGPHGLTVWPLPGQFSLGHIGNMR